MTTTRRDPIASSSSSSSSPPPDLYENKATKPAEHGKSASVPNLDDRDEKPDAVEPQGTLPTPPVRRKIQITDSNESRNPDNILDVDDDYGIHYKSQSTIRFVIDANKSVLELLEGECRRAANTLDVDDEHGLYYKAQSSMRCAVEANKSLLRLLEGDCRRTAETHDANSIRSKKSTPDVDFLSQLLARVETGIHPGSHTYCPNNYPTEFDHSRRPHIPRPPYPLPGHDPDLVTVEQAHAHFLAVDLVAGLTKPLPSGQGHAYAQAVPIPPAPVPALVPDCNNVQPPLSTPTPTSGNPLKEQSDFDALLRAGVEDSKKIADALRITRDDCLD